MNFIFHGMIRDIMEVYIDDVIIQSGEVSHLNYLKQAFIKMHKFKLKMNPLKSAFGVRASNFLGFLVNQRGIEKDKNKVKAILDLPPPTNKN